MMTLDPYTFGNSIAAVVLADRLERLHDKSLVRRVTTRLTNHNRIVKALDSIPDIKSRKSLLHIMLSNTTEGAFKEYPEFIRTYMCNVAHRPIKIRLRELDNVSRADYDKFYRERKIALLTKDDE